jgi:carboxymethylenebutenolidase
MDQVKAIGKAHPKQELFTYPAGHGFNCDMRGSHHADSAALARKRTLAFLERTIG